jgi:Arc/MetJ-type ribon-helix-helix transcriptional regulator
MASTEQLTVDLPADLVANLRDSVRSGAFASESEAIETLLRTWFGLEGDDDLESVRAMVAEGLAQADAGDVIEAGEVHAEIHARIKAIVDRGE